MPQEQNIVLTATQLQEAITNAVVTAVKEMKKPSDEEAQATADKKARLLANQKASAEEQVQRQKDQAAIQAACGHMKAPPYGDQHTIVGALHSDGMFHPVCFRCSKEFDPFPPGKDTLPHNVTLGSDECKRIPPKAIEAWGKKFQPVA